MKRLLLVDDNKKYAKILTEYFGKLGYTIDEGSTAAEGLEIFKKQSKEYYNVIVSDITMETQLSGITMLYKIRKLGFPGTVVVVSTGFDIPTVIPISRVCLRPHGVHYLVPKTTILKNDLEFWPMRFFSGPTKVFQEA